MADFSWVSSVDGDWSDSGDWNPTGIPQDSTNTVAIGATGTYTVEINSGEGFGVDSVSLNNAGTTLKVDGTLSLDGGFSIVAGKMTGAGFLNVNGGSIGGGTVSVANQTITGAVTLSATLKDTGQVSLGSSGADTLALGNKTLMLTGTGTTIAGTLTGNGMLALAGGTQAINSGASLGMAKMLVSGGAKVSLNTSLTYAGILNVKNAAALTVAGGDMFTLTGNVRLSGAVTGAVKVDHGDLTLNTTSAGAQLALAGGSVSVMRDLTYSGTLNDNGGAVMLGGKTLTVTGKTILNNVTLMTAGTFSTMGTTALVGVAVKAGATLSNLGLATIKGQIVLGDLKSAGQLDNAAGATLTLTNGQTASAIVDPAGLTADGIGADAKARPASVIHNKGIVQATQGGTRGGVRGTGDPTVHIAVTFQNLDSGTVKVRSGTLEFDGLFSNANGKAGAVSVASGTVLDLNGGGSSSAGAFSVAAGGLLEFTGGTFTLSAGRIAGAVSLTGGILAVDAGRVLFSKAFTNKSVVQLSAGRLDLAGAVSGSGGTFRISNGAFLAADAALPVGQGVVFGTGGGRLIVNDAAGFGATISGFGAKTGIDITGFKFSGKPKASFAEAASNKQGVLTITDGSQTFKVTLFGQYVAAGFHLSSDGAAGGTVVTYTTPAGHAVLAASH